MDALTDSLLQGDVAQEGGDSATRVRNGSSPGNTVRALSNEEADGQPRRRDCHTLKKLGGAVRDALRLVLRHHRGTLLLFVAMAINTFTTVFGALAVHSRNHCSLTNGSNLTRACVPLADATRPCSSCSMGTDDSNSATCSSQAVFGLCLSLFLCIGIPVVVVSSWMDKVKGVTVWVKAHFADMVAILSLTVYLAGANLSLVASLSVPVGSCGLNTSEYSDAAEMFSFRDIRNYLIAVAFLISIIPDVFKKYWNVLTVSAGGADGGSIAHDSSNSTVAENVVNGTQMHYLPTQQHYRSRSTCRRPKLRYLILQALFQMLSYTVHLDELYIIIQDEVSECRDDEDGRSCPPGFVKAGIVSFAIVSFLWVGISSVLVCKYAHDLDTAKIRQRQRNEAIGVNEVYSLRRRAVELCWTRKHLGLFLLWLVLAMYIPAYLALNNTWPWICVARCQLKTCEDSNNCREERCTHYFKTRIVLLFFLGLGTIALLLAYWCVVLLKETDRVEEEEEEEVEEEEDVVVDTHHQTVQESEDPGGRYELALNSNQRQSWGIDRNS